MIGVIGGSIAQDEQIVGRQLQPDLLAFAVVLVGFGDDAQADVARAALYGGICAACAVLGTGLMVSLSLYASSPDFAASSRIVVFSYAPLLVVEALVTGFCVSFVKRVKPELLARARSA
jgi:ABC-type Co2+ transport system permease subunit